MPFIHCPRCSQTVGNNDRFCSYCGFSLQTMSANMPSIADVSGDKIPIAAVSYTDNTYAHRPIPRNPLYSIKLINLKDTKLKAIAVTYSLFHLGLSDAKQRVESHDHVVARGLSYDRASTIAEEYKINGIDAIAFEEAQK